MSDLQGSQRDAGRNSGHGSALAQTSTGQADSHGAIGDDVAQREGRGGNGLNPLADPGLPAHRPRPTDVDPAAAKRAERQVATMFVVSALASIAFVAAYVVIPQDATLLGIGAQNLALGVTLGLALFLIGIAAIQWAKKLMVDEEVVEERHPMASTPQERHEAVEMLMEGGRESGLGRRPLIKLSILPALGLLVAPVIVLLRDLGTLPGNDLRHTTWNRGVRVVRDGVGTPVRLADIPIGTLINVMPATLYPTNGTDGQYQGPTTGEVAGSEDLGTSDKPSPQVVRARSAAIVVRMEPGAATVSPERANWNVDEVFCYSKICVHMGCPISLYEQQTHHLLCPCHQSIYDLADGGKIIFGPAARSMPQLPIMVDSEGYLVAQSDFTEPVGPAFWEQERKGT
jgi:ubiquinol-cytochrome c reductase iron-sulfur subunit